MSSPGAGERGLRERAQGWPLERRLRKIQEECGELIAAISRAIDSGMSENRVTEMAHELEGVRITLANVADDMGPSLKHVRAHQLQRLRDALQRSNL